MGCTKEGNDRPIVTPQYPYYCDEGERPVHRVTISRAFLMATTEITNAQYAKCGDAGVCKHPHELGERSVDPKFVDKSRAHYPVVNVSWNKARTFCEWANGRLPTEAEWEYAARGGRDWVYAVVPSPRENARVARGVWPVRSFGVNGFGLYDMDANVAEWCADWYSDTYYQYAPEVDPQGPANGKYRVVRGGQFHMTGTGAVYRGPVFMRMTTFEQVYYSETLGFRCARDSS